MSDWISTSSYVYGTDWNRYPLGTKARISYEGGYWIKLERGWKWCIGSVFPKPGLSDQICLKSNKIVCAALMYQDNIICGVRHYDPIMGKQIAIRPERDEWRTKAVQGFVDSGGIFLNRHEAYIVSIRTNQFNPEHIRKDEQLFSEDLY